MSDKGPWKEDRAKYAKWLADLLTKACATRGNDEVQVLAEILSGLLADDEPPSAAPRSEGGAT